MRMRMTTKWEKLYKNTILRLSSLLGIERKGIPAYV